MLSGTRSVEYYSTLGIELPRLRKQRPWPVLEMSPETAASLGVAASRLGVGRMLFPSA